MLPHVAFILTWPYPKVVGGAERWVSEAARALRAHAEVTEHYLDPDGQLTAGPTLRRHSGIRVPIREADRVVLSPALMREVARADVVHVHQYGTLQAQLLALVRRAWRRPVFVTDLGSSGLTLGSRLRLERLFDGYLCLSRFAAEQTPSDRTRVVYGGVSTEVFRPGDRSEQPFALFVGRLLPHKGIDWLIRSMPSGHRLVIAGRPDEEHAPGYLALLQELAVDRCVEFRLDPADQELAELYRTAWVTVLPSVWTDVYEQTLRIPELLGLTVLESMASGTPVIASRLGPLPEVVDDASGILVEPGDVSALRNALEQFLTNRRRVDRMGAAARARVKAEFTWPVVADRLMASYRELGGRRGL